MVEGVLQSSPEGTPQGGPLSPLLANILLDDLDKELERRGLLFVRYADDFMIFTKTRRAAERVFFALAKQMRLFENLDQWTRRRLRMYFWKRWRFVRTRAQNLLALALGQACSAPSNRVVQTRMLRGVGGGRSDLPAYPIRRFWVPYGAAFSNLALPRILRNTTNISLESLCDLATGFVDFLDNWISSLDHRHTPQACLVGCRSPEKEARNHPGHETRVAGSWDLRCASNSTSIDSLRGSLRQ